MTSSPMIGTEPDDNGAGEVESILIVDDDASFRRTLVRMMERAGYECEEAGCANQARALLRDRPFSLVLSDVGMPGESGLELVTEVASNYPNTATMMVTGRDEPELARVALEIGCYGYVIKPFERNQIVIEVMNAMRRRRLEIENRDYRENLEKTVRSRTTELRETIAELGRTQDELERSREETIHSLSIAAEFRDPETVKHLRRMSSYCALLAEKMGMDEKRQELIRLASVMHDVGKIGIPDHILLKPGSLTPSEWEVMKTHPEIGYRILSGSDSALLNVAAQIAVTHHERVDGTGYPHGLEQNGIPIEGRIAAVADVFDALTSDRVYRKGFTALEAIEMMKDERGKHFDPEVLDLFVNSFDSVLQIKQAYQDNDAKEVAASPNGAARISGISA